MENKKPMSFKDMMVLPVEEGENEHIKYRRMKYRKTNEEIEQDIDEEISVQTRLKKARTMKKNKTRLSLARKKAMRKTANIGKINQRSRKSARKALFLKISKGKNPSELSPSRRQEIENRLNSKQFQKRIQVGAKKLRPKMRELDRSRKTG